MVPPDKRKGWPDQHARGLASYHYQHMNYMDSVEALTTLINTCPRPNTYNSAQLRTWSEEDHGTLYANRALCYIEMEMWKEALADASKAMQYSNSPTVVRLSLMMIILNQNL